MDWSKRKAIVEYEYLEKIHVHKFFSNYKFSPKIDPDYWEIQTPTPIGNFVFDEYCGSGRKTKESLFEELNEVSLTLMFDDFDRELINEHEFSKRHGITRHTFWRKHLMKLNIPEYKPKNTKRN